MSYEEKLIQVLQDKEYKAELNTKSIFIYGAGNAGKIAFDNLKRLNVEKNIIAFLDKNADNILGKRFDLEVIKPDDECLLNDVKKESIVFIALICDEQEYEEIKNKLVQNGYGNIYHYLGLNCLERIKESDISNIMIASKMLEDNKSKEIYLKWINMGKVLSENLFENEDNQYFVNNIKFEKGYSRFIDCGAYTGDTAQEIKNNKGIIKAIACFEADINNYNILVENIKKNRVAEEEILIPCAVLDTQKVLKFNNNSNSSCISEDGNGMIITTSIDNCLKDFAPTFIKMDIEGSEEEALIGAKETIEKYKPDLAICVYHKIEHMWKLMIYINSIVKGYKFYMRCHHCSGMETVLYATYAEK